MFNFFRKKKKSNDNASNELKEAQKAAERKSILKFKNYVAYLKGEHQAILDGELGELRLVEYQLKIMETNLLFINPAAFEKRNIIKDPTYFFRMPENWFFDLNHVAECMVLAKNAYENSVKGLSKDEKSAKMAKFQDDLVAHASEIIGNHEREAEAAQRIDYLKIEQEVDELEREMESSEKDKRDGKDDL